MVQVQGPKCIEACMENITRLQREYASRCIDDLVYKQEDIADVYKLTGLIKETLSIAFAQDFLSYHLYLNLPFSKKASKYLSSSWLPGIS